jgi:hypothetical protein
VKTGPYSLLTQGHDAARDGAGAVLGKLNQDLHRLVHPCWTARRRTVKDGIAQLEIRSARRVDRPGRGREGGGAPEPGQPGHCHGPEGDRDALGDLGLDRSSWGDG